MIGGSRRRRSGNTFFLMPFILTTGYIDKVYKSVSSKRKQTHPSMVMEGVHLLMFVTV